MLSVTTLPGFGLNVYVHGTPLPKYVHNGKIYVPAAPNGTKYELGYIVPPESGYLGYRRWLAITSVDGLDIMTGRRAVPNSTHGYVVDYTSGRVRGFKLNDKEVAAFTFGEPEESYASQMDQPDNVGVIGVAYWTEEEPRRQMLGLEACDGGGMRGGAASTTRSGGGPRRGGHDVGTVFGDRVEQHTRTVEFQRGQYLTSAAIYYASRESLIADGIIPTGGLGSPEPFGGGCPTPRSWRG